ncbi:RNase E specificity factor CsrD [Affinibrenneria salicis]|uniref:RNase E specificity factor CsrD n=2 Tax=Affinibrenneria salicis TaxID=2590031 RepID=A0A5J5FYW7_9GAMM|nr:RNase E specificity factor CsrD [Affinibrenneria salicis]
MGLTTRLSILITLLIALAMVLIFLSQGAPVAILISVAIVAALLWGLIRGLRRHRDARQALEARAQRILDGARENILSGAQPEWPQNVSQALDLLLADLLAAREERNRIDTLIRSFAAQDAETGLNNRLFFDNQLTTQLDDVETGGTHGVVMMIRVPDFDLLQETSGVGDISEFRYALVNLLSTFVMRYPSALLARYFHSEFAVLLPHRTLKEADSIAAQLIKAIDILPFTPGINREALLHIGICAWRSGQPVEQVMESVEDATRHAVLQGGNSWYVYDRQVPDKGRGSVKWRTLLEHTLSHGGPRLYQKPAVTRAGKVHHRELMSRIFDGSQEVLAAEYMPLVRQLGLTASYDRLQISRAMALLARWPQETIAIPACVDSLLQPPFLRWLQEALLHYTKEQRRRILFELAEADVCQYMGRLQPVLDKLGKMGCRLAVTQAGLTLVSCTYIRSLTVEIIKLHPGLVRNLEQRTENQLYIQSLTEACKGSGTQVFAAGVRSKAEWQTLLDKGVRGGQGDFFMSSRPVDDALKKYSSRGGV